MSNRHRHPGPVPPRWLKCPRKSNELVAGKFLAMKTPLDERFFDQVPPEYRFSPSMLFSSMSQYKVKIGLWIDLCNTSRFYDKREIEKNECRYVKLQCRGHGETPSQEQVNTFVTLCKRFIQQNPLEVIAVHCTHGFNRTGYMISAFLIETEDWSPEAASNTFKAARPPGIYKEDYLRDLYTRYEGDADDVPTITLPDWCYEDDDDGGGDNVDDDGNPVDGGSAGTSAPRFRGKTPVFMEGVGGATPVMTQPLLKQLQRKVNGMCGFKGKAFPGAQPVSMDRDNMRYLSEPYQVSWKADGTRYMMLIDKAGEIYLIDRDNNFFRVDNLVFLDRKNPASHLYDTLIDGEMVIDVVRETGEKRPRYLAYDIVSLNGEIVANLDFIKRMARIRVDIVSARNDYIVKGIIDKTKEPFSIRQKHFWDKHIAPRFFEEKFLRNLSHEPDGLIFQPVEQAYKAGTDDKILKWKPSSHNSIDFKLCIERENRPGMVAKSLGRLYVGGQNCPFGEIKLGHGLRQLHNKIIECKWDNQSWVFMRERTDKSFPNAYKTALAVMKSITEPVTQEMLLQFIASLPKTHPPPFDPHSHHHHHHRTASKRPASGHLMMPPPPPKFPNVGI